MSGGKLVHNGPGEEFSLLTIDNVAGLLCCSERTVSRMADAAAMPPPLKIFRSSDGDVKTSSGGSLMAALDAIGGADEHDESIQSACCCSLG